MTFSEYDTSKAEFVVHLSYVVREILIKGMCYMMSIMKFLDHVISFLSQFCYLLPMFPFFGGNIFFFDN